MMSPVGGSGNNIRSPGTDSSGSDSWLKRIKKTKTTVSRDPSPVVSNSNSNSRRSRSRTLTPKQMNIVNSDGETEDKMSEARNLDMDVDVRLEQPTRRFFKQNPRLRLGSSQGVTGTANPGVGRLKLASGSKEKVLKRQVSRRGRGGWNAQNRSTRRDENLNQTQTTRIRDTSESSKENAKQGFTSSNKRTNLGLVIEKDPNPEHPEPVAKRLESVIKTGDAKATVDDDIAVKKDKNNSYCFGFSSNSGDERDWEKIYLNPVKRKRTISTESESDSCQILEDPFDVTAPTPSPPTPVSVSVPAPLHNQNEIQTDADAETDAETDVVTDAEAESDEDKKNDTTVKNTISLRAIIARLTSDLEERDDQILLLQGQLASSEHALHEAQKSLVERGRGRGEGFIEQDTIEVRGSQRILGPQQLLAEQAAKYKKLQDEFSEYFIKCSELTASLVAAERKVQALQSLEGANTANQEYQIIVEKQQEQILHLQEELKEMEQERSDFQTQYDNLAYSSYHTPSFGFRSGETSHLHPLYPTWPFSGFSYQRLNLKRKLSPNFSDESSSISPSRSNEVQKVKRRRD